MCTQRSGFYRMILFRRYHLSFCGERSCVFDSTVTFLSGMSLTEHSISVCSIRSVRIERANRFHRTRISGISTTEIRSIFYYICNWFPIFSCILSQSTSTWLLSSFFFSTTVRHQQLLVRQTRNMKLTTLLYVSP